MCSSDLEHGLEDMGRGKGKLENKMVEITAREQNKEKRMRIIEDSLRDLWNSIKSPNIRVIGVPEEEQKEKGSEKIFEEISQKLP